MILTEHFDKLEDLEMLAQSGISTRQSIMLLKVAKLEAIRETENVMKRGMVDDVDFKKDFRYRMGMAAAYSAIANIPVEAARNLALNENKQTEEREHEDE